MYISCWELKEAVRPFIYALGVVGASFLSLYAFAKVTYKMHKIGLIK